MHRFAISPVSLYEDLVSIYQLLLSTEAYKL